MKISCIVAAANNNVIGKDNEIPWYLPADLKYFKKVTTGHHIIMGRNCFESIGRALPNRTNVIITRDMFYTVSDCLISHSVGEALSIAENNGETEAFIIGGGQIYEQTIELWDKLYLTEVNLETDGDVFFPTIDLSQWKLTKNIQGKKDEKNTYAHSFLQYDRIT